MADLREVLVVSSDHEVLRNLAGTIGLCGLESVLSVTVADSRVVLAQYPICVVLCDDRLVDGNYRDLVEEVGRTAADVPVVVVSRMGDWGQYMKAMSAGAFDYIGFPPRRAEIERVIGNALHERERRRQLEGGQARQPSTGTG